MMATSIQTPGRNQPSLAASQICQQLAALREQESPAKSPELRSISNYSDKENNHDKTIHQEILDKLKHDASPAAHMQAEQWLNYQKLRAAALSESPMVSQHAAELLRREALLSLQSRAKFDYFQHLASMQEQQAQSQQQHKPMNSPSRGSQSPDECDDIDMEMMSPSPGPANGQWTYEEQFKQLYELGDEPERKVFLDELFAFMQKRGTPINRIPIMAKQTLDMYKLFKLVVSKGGLVEVINKKLWREITKGLNLPSSITSAAFTLRTQYMKYIYPYECEKFSFSSPNELQAAIDGNRREGRRPGYGYDIPSPSLPPFYGQQSFPAANPFFNPLMSNPMAGLLSGSLSSAYMGSSAINNSPLNHPRLSAPPSQIPTSTASAEERNHSPIDASNSLASPATPADRSHHTPQTRRSISPDSEDSINKFSPKRLKLHNTEQQSVRHQTSTHLPSDSITNMSLQMNKSDFKDRISEVSSTKQQIKPSSPIHISSSHIRITANDDQSNGSRPEGVQSVAVSMEVNGVLYQGVLYAKRQQSD